MASTLRFSSFPSVLLTALAIPFEDGCFFVFFYFIFSYKIVVAAGK